MTLQDRINWQISEIRGWKKVDAGFGCISLVDPEGNTVVTSRHPERIAEAEIDWYSDAHWPTLFREFPKGTRLYQPDKEGTTVPWALCGCPSNGPVRVCQPGSTIGEVVCKGWLAFRLGSDLSDGLPVRIFTNFGSPSPGSNSVN